MQYRDGFRSMALQGLYKGYSLQGFSWDLLLKRSEPLPSFVRLGFGVLGLGLLLFYRGRSTITPTRIQLRALITLLIASSVPRPSK